MNSYLHNPTATSEILGPLPTPKTSSKTSTATSSDKDALGPWLRTGDVCYVSAGKWYVVFRAKELIKVRGWQVAPAELEGVLVSHPKILDAAVVGVKLRNGEEAPRAFVLRAPGVEDGLGEEAVKSFMGERLARYKSLDGGVVFVEAIPKNMTGKTDKKKLTEKYPYVP
jgi:acyl-CoA synthetase (AMP-forming)/AMP-acid ligase II